MPLPVCLGVDAGGSSTKWVLMQGQTVLARGQAPALTAALVHTPAGKAALRAQRSSLPVTAQRAHFGLPGLSAGTPQAGQLRQELAASLGLGPEAVGLESDLDLAYSAHFAPGEGILVYAGTGSMAYHLPVSGEPVRAGGRGYRIGDEGGGASIGRAALHWVTDFLDRGEEPHGPLAAEVAKLTGGLDWPTLRAFVYGTPGARSLALVAPAVTCAAQLGDPQALQLLREAACALVRLTKNVQLQTGPLPAKATGGALQSAPLQQALQQQLPTIQIAFADHAWTAAGKAARTT
ncbi:N-acetylglucosamine kinase [Deinococcus sp.]|uniref:N-acetylglucosamine kinase n=1 Tax=Deinococcus sp. TaxID=47478 RepID=UPI0025C4D277|nr:BadF/BadG/BcrA/BcrD ATPase family protein [Deinococcus sp.]